MKRSSGVKASQMAILCYQMSLIYKSGISVMEGLQLLAEEVEDKRLKPVLEHLCEALSGGRRLYEVFRDQTELPEYAIRMIEVGELSGTLDEVMAHLSDYYERTDNMNKRIHGAVVYPLVLMGLMMVIVAMLMVKVLPMFEEIIASVGGEMPGFTQLIIYISAGLKANGLWLLTGLLAGILAVLLFSRTPRGKLAKDFLKLRLPIVKSAYVKLYAARFSLSMSLLLRSGISYTEALRLVSTTIGNNEIQRKIDRYRVLVEAGEDDKDAFRDIGIFPNLMVRMVKMGHKTGELDTIMSKIAKVFEQEVDRELQRLTGSVEPILIIFLSAVVGGILMAVMLPLVNIMSSIG